MKHLFKIFFFVILFSGCNADQEQSKPNIIYILADDLGYGEVGYLGQKIIETPNIDKLAKDGMIFTEHYAGSNICAPSRCVLMTGKHTGNATVRWLQNIENVGTTPIHPDEPTVSEMFKQ
ncbi:MAG: sulfatase-like hydrolase/transferase, partial [Draconibacterium sp.]|nr:sulfatase-like hydrolase/transferase [Draconibacterium sp.]